MIQENTFRFHVSEVEEMRAIHTLDPERGIRAAVVVQTFSVAPRDTTWEAVQTHVKAHARQEHEYYCIEIPGLEDMEGTITGSDLEDLEYEVGCALNRCGISVTEHLAFDLGD